MSLPEPTPDPSPESRQASQASDTLAPYMTDQALGAPPPYTGQDWAMFALGTLLAIVSLVTGIGPVVLAVVFFVTKPPRSPIMRGIGLGLIIVGAVVGGALSLCFIMLGAATVGNGVR